MITYSYWYKLQVSVFIGLAVFLLVPALAVHAVRAKLPVIVMERPVMKQADLFSLGLLPRHPRCFGLVFSGERTTPVRMMTNYGAVPAHPDGSKIGERERKIVNESL